LDRDLASKTFYVPPNTLAVHPKKEYDCDARPSSTARRH
jgi:hypothetical protein